MKDKTRIAIERLTAAITNYDTCKVSHAETTTELTEAKKRVDLCARAVVDAEHGEVGLFDDVEVEAEAEVAHAEVDAEPAQIVFKPGRRRRAAAAT